MVLENLSHSGQKNQTRFSSNNLYEGGFQMVSKAIMEGKYSIKDKCKNIFCLGIVGKNFLTKTLKSNISSGI